MWMVGIQTPLTTDLSVKTGSDNSTAMAKEQVKLSQVIGNDNIKKFSVS